MQPLLARDLVKVYEDRPVLDGISITAAPGRRIGLVGENGAGKSTLLRLLAGTEPPDSGEVTRPADTGLLAQALPFAGHATVRTVVDDALADVRRALRRLDELATRLDDEHALREYGEVLEWAQARDAWDADRRATLVLDGLGLAEVDTRRRLDTLLGGPRSRLALAALLVRRPGALLLDEPTNHLDDEAVAFVEAHLRGLPGVVVLASHDRVFLDAVCTAVVDLDPSRAGVTRYGGAYSDYLHAKRAERARWEQQYATEQGELVALRHAVAVTSRLVSHERAPRDNDKMAYDFFGGRVQRQISCRVRNAVQRLDERTARQVRKPPAPLRFAATVTAAGSSGLALSARGLRVSGRVGSRSTRWTCRPTGGSWSPARTGRASRRYSPCWPGGCAPRGSAPRRWDANRAARAGRRVLRPAADPAVAVRGCDAARRAGSHRAARSRPAGGRALGGSAAPAGAGPAGGSHPARAAARRNPPTTCR